MRYKNIIEEIVVAINQRITRNAKKWTICLDGSKIVCLQHDRIPFEVKPIQTFTQLELTNGLRFNTLLELEIQIVKVLKEQK